MEFYVIIVPPLILSILMIFQLLKMARQDRHLFAEHQELSKLMEPIRANNFSLSKEDYTRLRLRIDGKELIDQYVRLTHQTKETESIIGLTLSPLAHHAKK